MSWHTVKLDPADKYFSHYIRLKAKKCAYCGRRGEGKDGIDGLQASHYHSRRKESVRFDEQNVDVLCIACHRTLGTYNRPAYTQFKMKQLGEKGYDLLTLRANTTGKKERKLEAIYWRGKVKELEKHIALEGYNKSQYP